MGGKIMYRYDIINHFITKLNLKTYLEIGVFDGECIQKINCPIKDGVDPCIERGLSIGVNYKMTSDDFFNNNRDKIYDIIFIDGLHHSEQVDIDIENSLKQTSNNGIVILHDCNPPTLEHTLIPRVQPQWNGDVYKSILKFRKNNINHKYFTIDCDWGVGVIMKNSNLGNKVKNIDFEMGIVSWDYFDFNRNNLLNLITVEEFKTLY
jgi:hypothetical protein